MLQAGDQTFNSWTFRRHLRSKLQQGIKWPDQTNDTGSLQVVSSIVNLNLRFEHRVNLDEIRILLCSPEVCRAVQSLVDVAILKDLNIRVLVLST